jgi:hypothetical protein
MSNDDLAAGCQLRLLKVVVLKQGTSVRREGSDFGLLLNVDTVLSAKMRRIRSPKNIDTAKYWGNDL